MHFTICTQPIISKFFHTEIFPEQCIGYNTSKKLDFGDVSFHKINPCIHANPFTEYFLLRLFLTNLVFMGSSGYLLMFCMLKRQVETKKTLIHWSPSSQMWLFCHRQPKTDKILSGLLGGCAQNFQKLN